MKIIIETEHDKDMAITAIGCIQVVAKQSPLGVLAKPLIDILNNAIKEAQKQEQK